jgi:hypothetical protein
MYTVYKKSGKWAFTEEQKNLICDLYLNEDKSSSAIAKLFGIPTPGVIINILKDKNVKITYKTYKFNENYFDVIDDENKAYILGLLYADGCNHYEKGMLSLSLQEDDRHILDEINALLNNKKPLVFENLHSKNINYHNQHRIALYSRHLCDVMNDYGMTPRKSRTLTFPSWLNKDLYRHFIRGYVDGDGSIYWNDKTNNGSVSMIGTEQFLLKVLDILRDNGINVKISNNHSIKELKTTSKEDMVKLITFLYYNVNLKLNRKYQKCVDFFKHNSLNSLTSECDDYNNVMQDNVRIIKLVIAKSRSKNYGKPKKVFKEGSRAGASNPRSRSIYCPELNRIFWGAMEVYYEFGIDFSRIGKVCKGLAGHAGVHPVTGEPLHWVYVDQMDNIDNSFVA